MNISKKKLTKDKKKLITLLETTEFRKYLLSRSFDERYVPTDIPETAKECPLTVYLSETMSEYVWTNSNALEGRIQGKEGSLRLEKQDIPNIWRELISDCLIIVEFNMKGFQSLKVTDVFRILDRNIKLEEKLSVVNLIQATSEDKVIWTPEFGGLDVRKMYTLYMGDYWVEIRDEGDAVRMAGNTLYTQLYVDTYDPNPTAPLESLLQVIKHQQQRFHEESLNRCRDYIESS